MEPIVNFLNAERQRAGSRFFVLWIVATNLAFFPGVWFSVTFREPFVRLVVGDDFPLAAREAILSLTVAILLAIMQSWVIRRHVSDHYLWAGGYLLGWPLGIFFGVTLFEAIAPDQPFGSFLYLVVVAAIAGATVGLPHAFAFRGRVKRAGWWWIGVSSVGWAVQAPGVVTGLVLVTLLSDESTH